MLGLNNIYDTQLEICWYNYLLNYVLFDYLGKKGFGLIMVETWDRLPKGVPEKCMNKYDMVTKTCSNPARDLQHVVMVEKEKESEGVDKYEYVEKTLHSISSCNIQAVKRTNQCSY